MEDWMKDALKKAGVDVERTIQRFMGNEGLFMKFLIRFPEDENFSQIKPSLDQNDFDAALTAAHTLKGVSGNLGIMSVFDICSEMVALIRKEEFDKAKQTYGKLEAAYQEVCRIIVQSRE